MKIKHAQQLLNEQTASSTVTTVESPGLIDEATNGWIEKFTFFRYYHIEEALVNPLFSSNEFELDKITSPSIICIEYRQTEEKEEIPVRIYTIGGWQNLVKGKL